MTVLTEEDLLKAQPRHNAPSWEDEAPPLVEEVFGRLLVLVALICAVLIVVGVI